MITKGVVKSVTPNGHWDGQYGTIFKFDVCINDHVGEYGSKSKDQTKFVVGQETEYEFIDGNYPKIKPVNTFQQGGGFTPKPSNDKVQEFIIKQSSLKASIDYCNVNGGDISKVIETAEVFANWVLKGDKPSSNNNLPF